VIHVPPPPSNTPPSPVPDLELAIRESGQRFEQSLRRELGMASSFVDIDQYVRNYKTELRAFHADLVKRGLAQ